MRQLVNIAMVKSMNDNNSNNWGDGQSRATPKLPDPAICRAKRIASADIVDCLVEHAQTVVLIHRNIHRHQIGA